MACTPGDGLGSGYQLCRDRVWVDDLTYGVVRPVSNPGGQETDERTGNEISSVMPIIHRSRDRDKDSASERSE